MNQYIININGTGTSTEIIKFLESTLKSIKGAEEAAKILDTDDIKVFLQEENLATQFCMKK